MWGFCCAPAYYRYLDDEHSRLCTVAKRRVLKIFTNIHSALKGSTKFNTIILIKKVIINIFYNFK